MRLSSLIAIVVLGAGAAAVLAQGPGHPPGGNAGRPRMGQGGPGGRMGGRMNKMEDGILKQVGAKPSQMKKIEVARKARMQAMQAAFKKMGGQPGQRPDRTKMRAIIDPIRKGYEAKLKKILTGAQFAKYEKLMAAERAKMRQERGGGSRSNVAK